jgi:hypothetical protein
MCWLEGEGGFGNGLLRDRLSWADAEVKARRNQICLYGNNGFKPDALRALRHDFIDQLEKERERLTERCRDGENELFNFRHEMGKI